MLHPSSTVHPESKIAIKSNAITNLIEALDPKAVLTSDSHVTKRYVNSNSFMSGNDGKTFFNQPVNDT